MKGGCFGVDTDRMDYETALPVLVLVNQGCFKVDNDQIDC